jgi:hypothetical protein
VRVVWPAIVLAALLGCRHLGASETGCSGEGVRFGALTPRTLHVRAQLVQGGVATRHEAVVQIARDAVTLVGLTPIGTRAFAVEAGPRGLALDEGIGGRMGQSPHLLYDAVARAWLAPLDAADEPPPPAVVTHEPEGAVRVANPRCGYEARLLLMGGSSPPAKAPDP